MRYDYFAKPHTKTTCSIIEWRADEFIKERERYALIGDDLDFAFIELIPGVGMAYNDRHPKPPSPERVHTGDTPPKEPTPPAGATTEEGAAPAAPALDADGNPIPVPEGAAPAADGAAAPADGAAEGKAATPPVEPEPEVKGPPPPPPKFDYRLDLPPDAAEVPFVRNYEPPSTRSSSASASPSPPREAGPPADAAAAAAPAAEGAPAPAPDAPAAAPAEAAPAPAAEAAPAAAP